MYEYLCILLQEIPATYTSMMEMNFLLWQTSWGKTENFCFSLSRNHKEGLKSQVRKERERDKIGI